MKRGQIIPDFEAIIAANKKHPNQMLIKIETGSFQEHETRTIRHHRALHQGTYISVKKWRTYITQIINLSAKQVFWLTREDEKPRTYVEKVRTEDECGSKEGG